MIAVIILAAGAARRMGQSKQLLPLGGKTLVWQTANAACQANLGEVIVVTGAQGDRVKAALTDLPLQVVHNAKWEAGQATSVRAGVLALEADVQAVIFLPADQPLVTPELLTELVSCYHSSGAATVLPCFQGRRGSPVLFDLTFWRQELLSLEGDKGGRELLNSQPDKVATLEITDGSLLFDADSLAEYEQLRELWVARQGGPACADN
jgi:molybdenum cofactor cytidylyltransferase